MSVAIHLRPRILIFGRPLAVRVDERLTGPDSEQSSTATKRLCCRMSVTRRSPRPLLGALRWRSSCMKKRQQGASGNPGGPCYGVYRSLLALMDGNGPPHPRHLNIDIQMPFRSQSNKRSTVQERARALLAIRRIRRRISIFRRSDRRQLGGLSR